LRVNLVAVDAIDAMVAPVVLLTVGVLLSNGMLTVYNGINERMRQMTRERFEIVGGSNGEVMEVTKVPAIGRERLNEIKFQLPLLLRTQKLTRASVLTIYSAIAVLGLSIVVIAIAVVAADEIAGRVALGMVLAGTIILLLGIGVAALSLAKSSEAIAYAVERTHLLDQ